MAQMTIDTTAQQAQRLATALGRKLNLRDGSGALRDATPAEIKKYTVDMLRGVVLDVEAELARQQISLPAAWDPA